MSNNSGGHGEKRRTIRASMLPGYADCARRAAAKQFRRELEEMGYELRQVLPSVGAAAGTAVHAVAATVMQSRIDGKEVPAEQALEQALAGFDEEVSGGCEWDDTTRNRDAAQKQILRMSRAYLAEFRGLRPKAVELPVEANMGDSWRLSGHIDLITEDGWVRDLKTGAVSRPYLQQLGAYSLLVRSQRILEPVGLAVDFIKRCPLRREQDPVVSRGYEVALAEGEAWATVLRIRRDFEAFQGAGDVREFACNPSSMMCSERFCPAWGTAFCGCGG